MQKFIEEPSPRFTARIAGIFELLEALTFTGGQVIILGRLIVPNNALTSATNLQLHKQLYWLGFSLCLLSIIFHIVWAFLFYKLFKPVSRSVSLLAVYIILVGCAVQTITCLFYIAPWLALSQADSVNSLTAGQLQLFSLMLKLNAQAFDIYLVFFGFWCVLSGYLVFRSNFMPRLLGVLFMVSGLGWVTFLVPLFAHKIFPAIAVASALGEFPMMVWLIAFGVNAQKLKEDLTVYK